MLLLATFFPVVLKYQKLLLRPKTAASWRSCKNKNISDLFTLSKSKAKVQ